MVVWVAWTRSECQTCQYLHGVELKCPWVSHGTSADVQQEKGIRVCAAQFKKFCQLASLSFIVVAWPAQWVSSVQRCGC